MTIQWTIEEGIGRITLCQPPSNTMTMGFFEEMQLLVQTISKTDGLKAIIISGSGRHYSSGANISELLVNLDDQKMLDNYRAFVMLEQLKTPVISAIRGVCLGSAFELALFSHFRFCADDAVLGLPESTFNLMPGLGGIQRVAALAGKAKAVEIILRGITFSAADALEMGLVDAVVPKGEVLPLSLSFAKSLPAGVHLSDRAACLFKYLKPSHATG
ncbi:MAG: enoyl-CoA hydratase/isomerase family protein [bacterium]